METLTAIDVHLTNRSRLGEVDFESLEFGKYVTDHMLICDYAHSSWQTPKIVPFSNLSMSPTTLALHYGQTVFEGMKAFHMNDGHINIFRMDKHYDRFVKSLERMCMAVPPREIFVDGLSKLISIDRDWVPREPGGALYIRPFIYASEAKFGVKISDEYRFVVFAGPVPELYAHPIKVKVEPFYVRAARGGTGFAKCGGNYGGAYYPTKLARDEGYDQVLWTDAKEHRFIEESGMMNAMFVMKDQLLTPPLSDSILDGITRDSLLTIADDLGFKTVERPVSVEELEIALRNGTLQEAFGAGTAAVIAPIRTIHINGNDFHLPESNASSLSSQLKQKLTRIRLGLDIDLHGWNWMI